ncbi:MAG: hypothetical protein CMI17_07590 [Opitutaceae bacterium]|nr:hypothetical protein [Opitutaceae bacterium]
MGAILWSRVSLAMKRTVEGLTWGRELIAHYQMTSMIIMIVVFWFTRGGLVNWLCTGRDSMLGR